MNPGVGTCMMMAAGIAGVLSRESNLNGRMPQKATHASPLITIEYQQLYDIYNASAYTQTSTYKST
jgi:hypothetical protein